MQPLDVMLQQNIIQLEARVSQAPHDTGKTTMHLLHANGICHASVMGLEQAAEQVLK